MTFIGVCGKDIKVSGRLVRMAQVDADDYKFLDTPEPVLAELRRSRMRIDLFTFMQRLPDTSRKYACLIEYDRCGAVPLFAFDHR